MAAGRRGRAPGRARTSPTRLEVPPEVAHAYTGIRISWKDKSNGKEGIIEVPLGGATPLPDPSLVVRADVFLPAFTMGGGAITSEGVEPQNPAARIAVFEKGKEIFGGWIFTRFPDVHPFTHPRFQLTWREEFRRPESDGEAEGVARHPEGATARGIPFEGRGGWERDPSLRSG